MDTKITNLLKNPNQKMNTEELDALAAYFRRTMWDVLHQRQTGHWGGSASSAELVTALYFNRMNIKTDAPQDEDRDRFILSKGHASVNLYTVLANRGYFSTDALPSFRVMGSELQGHPCMTKLPGVDMSTGALGHGLSVGLGMSLAARMKDKKYWTYVMTGEGCLDEGQSWEAIMMAAKYKPKNFVLMVDYNKVQLDGTQDEIMPLGPLEDKFKAFGWNVYPKKCDGNSSSDILDSFKWMDSDDVWPKVCIYDTIKGKGVSFTEGKNTWHGKPIDDDSFKKGLVELDEDVKNKESRI